MPSDRKPEEHKPMSAHCCNHDPEPSAAQANSPRYRRILWIALAVNLAMFGIEIGAVWPKKS